jgi:hypothetical protein
MGACPTFLVSLAVLSSQGKQGKAVPPGISQLWQLSEKCFLLAWALLCPGSRSGTKPVVTADAQPVSSRPSFPVPGVQGKELVPGP